MKSLDERVQTNHKYITTKASTMKNLRRDYADVAQTNAYLASMKAVEARSRLYSNSCSGSGLNPIDDLRRALKGNSILVAAGP